MRFTPFFLPLAIVLSPVLGHAAAFTAGNVVVYRVGNGTETLLSTGNSVFLDEYTPLLIPNKVPVQSIALPTSASGSNHALIASGVASSEGLMNLSPDGQYLTFTGYDATPTGLTTAGGGVKLSDSTSINRVVGLVGTNGVVNTSTSLNDFATGNNPRSAVTVDGTHVYAAGGSDGIRYASIGGSTSVQLNTDFPNLRNVGVFGGQLFASSGVAGLRLGAVNAAATPLPTTSGQTITNLLGIPSAGNGDNYDQFYFADLSASVPGLDTLYVANEGNGSSTNPGGILKFGLSGGQWVPQGSIAGSETDPYHGLTGITTNGVVTLFATTVGNSDANGGGHLYEIADATGATGSLTSTPFLLATAGVNESFRGVAFTPGTIPEPAALPTLFSGLAALGGFTRARRTRAGSRG